jgi:hypothetical protein
MKTLIGIVEELVGLFVEDGALAIAIVAVVVVAGIFTALIPAAPVATAAILLIGCLSVLVVNVMQARKR